ncbi:MAG: hypothetical protein WKG00_36815 [Polyangiaceae bacterium]
MSTTALRVSSRGIVVRGMRAFRRGTAAVLVASAALTIAVSLLPGGWMPLAVVARLWTAGLLGAVMSGGALAWTYFFHDPTLATARARGGAGSIEVVGEVIVVDVDGMTRRYPTDHVAAGWTEPADGGHAAVLRMKDGDLVSVRVEDAAAADALLRAAGVSPERMALRIRLPSRAEQQIAGRATAVVQLLALAIFALPCLAGMAWLIDAMVHSGETRLGILLGVVGFAVAISGLLLYRIVAFLASPSVVVGTDGIAIQRGRWRRYLPYRLVVAVETYPRGVRVRTRDGKAILLPTWTSASARAARPAATDADRRAAELDEARREVLHERIRGAMASGGGDLAHAELALLDRAGRSLERWREDLGRLLEGATYRGVGLDHDSLEQVVSDPGAAPCRRVAAAFALSRTDDRALRERAHRHRGLRRRTAARGHPARSRGRARRAGRGAGDRAARAAAPSALAAAATTGAPGVRGAWVQSAAASCAPRPCRSGSAARFGCQEAGRGAPPR